MKTEKYCYEYMYCLYTCKSKSSMVKVTNIFKIIDASISFYSRNTNLLPPPPPPQKKNKLLFVILN